MKGHTLFLSLLIAVSRSCWADSNEARRACLFNNGLNNSTDMNRLMELLKPDATKTTTTVRDVAFENKFACAIACDFHIAKDRNVTLHGNLEHAIDTDDQLDDARKNEMKDSLQACRRATDVDDDCGLLMCVRILQPPFVGIILKTRGV